MNEITADALNARFAIPGHLTFGPVQGGLVAAQVNNTHARATIALHGGHVMAFQPHGQAPVLWLSGKSRFEAGAPIRGGIPICWPWFGQHPSAAQAPFHGFARLHAWEVTRTGMGTEGDTEIDLSLPEPPGVRTHWPHAWTLRLRIRVGAALRVELDMHNAGPAAMTCTTALHSYFTVSDIATVRVLGLDGCRYLDTVQTPPTEHVQAGPITFSAETDRPYFDTEADCVIEDPGLSRRLRIAKSGSRSTVVWNPWIAKSIRMPDFGDDEYHGMVCVETVNTGSDARTLPPGATHCIATRISVEPLS